MNDINPFLQSVGTINTQSIQYTGSSPLLYMDELSLFCMTGYTHVTPFVESQISHQEQNGYLDSYISCVW